MFHYSLWCFGPVKEEGKPFRKFTLSSLSLRLEIFEQYRSKFLTVCFGFEIVLQSLPQEESQVALK